MLQELEIILILALVTRINYLQLIYYQLPIPCRVPQSVRPYVYK